MVKLRLGKINNEERKFIPTKMEYLEKYLNGMECIEEYILMQTYLNGFKYREYNDGGVFKYTRNNKMSKITDVKEISSKEFYDVLKNNDYKCVRKIRKYYIDGDYEIDADYFIEPIRMVMIEVSSTKPLEDYVPPKGFLEVSNTKTFENYGIYNGMVKANRTIIEGTDGVGKTETIKKLLEDGIICQDRLVEVVSKNMFFDIDMDIRAKRIEDYLINNNNDIIILINNDKEELEKRIRMREVLSEYDLEAFRYNQLYLDTFNYMKENKMLHNKMFLVDCTHLTIDEQVREVKKIIER